MKKDRILYLNYTSILTQGILLSQVVVPLKRLASEGYKITLVSGERGKDLKKRRERESLHRELEEAGVELVFFRKTLPPYLRMEAGNLGSSPLRALCFLYDYVRFFFMTGWLVLSRKCRIIHARSYVPALVGLFYQLVFRVRLIFDPRGILPEELMLARRWDRGDLRYRFWKWVEKLILRRADTVIALSRPFKRHLRQIVPRSDIFITPCCIDPERFNYDETRRQTMRTSLGLGDKFALVYSIGCFVPYQVLERAAELFSILREEQPDARMLILTPEAVTMQDYAKRHGLDMTGVSLVRAPFSQVPDYLMACDAGLLVRHPSIVSRVASPVKFAEYLSCGLPVLAFSGIGDTEFIIKRFSVGECVEPDDREDIRRGIRCLLSLVKSYGPGLREQCHVTAMRFFSWDTYLPIYRRIYEMK
jgi:glycosyltransferase involved in cell wall biosynthesis